MSPDWGHDVPNLTAGLPYPPVRTSSLGHGTYRVTSMAELEIISLDQSLRAKRHVASEVAVLATQEYPSTTEENDNRPISLRSSSTQTSLSSSQSRRDSGYSSSKQTTTKSHRGSRTSSKQSLSSTRDTATSHESHNRPTRPRLSSLSRVQSSKMSISDARALHERSKKLFAPTSQPQSPTLGLQEVPPPVLQPVLHRTMSTPHYPRPPSRRTPVARTQTFNTLPRTSGLRCLSDVDFSRTEEASEDALVPPPVTMHWTSPETRRREYAQIDKQTRGLRGIWNKVMPKFMRSSSTKFYDEKDDSDAGSVRRYRLD